MIKMKIPLLFAAIVAVFAISSAQAMAFTSFVAKPGSGTIKGKVTTEQKFVSGENGEVVCGAATASGKVLAEKTTEQELEFKYEKCKAFGFVEVTITPEKYTFHINGEVKLNNEVKIETIGCKLIVPSGQTFAAGSVVYENSGLNLKGLASTSGIVYKGTGSTCPHSGSNGTYKGGELLEGNNPPLRVNVE